MLSNHKETSTKFISVMMEAFLPNRNFSQTDISQISENSPKLENSPMFKLLEHKASMRILTFFKSL